MKTDTTLTDTEIAFRMPRGRYFVMRANGTFWRENSYGKAMRFAFEQLPAARAQCARRDGCYILDAHMRTRLSPTG